ncbi:alginate export family protein [Candidatus Omnitrophota bacterium]
MHSKIVLAIGILSCLTLGPASGADTAIKISGDITAQYVTRDLSLGSKYSQFGFNTSDAEDFLLAQTRLRFDADIDETTSAVIRLLSERSWGAEDEALLNAQNHESQVQLDVAYLRVEEFFGLPLTLRAGRQRLKFGRGFIIGDPDSDRFVAANSFIYNLADDLSLRKSFDSLRATIDLSPLVIDLVYAKIEENFSDIKDDVTLNGCNAAYQFDQALIEGYFWAKENNDKGVNNNAPSQEYATRIFTAGLRAEGTITERLFLYGEYAYQFGDYIGQAAGPSQKMRSFAGQAGLHYQCRDPHNSQVGLEYSYASTDDGDTPDRFETWDVMFEDQRTGEIAQIFWSRGLHYLKLSCSTMPRHNLRVGFDLYYLRLSDSWLKGNGSVDAAYPVGTPVNGNVYTLDYNKKELGSEIDPYVFYDYSENIRLGFICGFFIPGSMWNETNDSTAYSVRTFAKLSF